MGKPGQCPVPYVFFRFRKNFAGRQTPNGEIFFGQTTARAGVREAHRREMNLAKNQKRGTLGTYPG